MQRATYGSSAKEQAEEQAYRLDQIESGRQATLALAVLVEPIDKMKENIVRSMINIYRSGELSHDLLIGKIAELSALDNMENSLINTQEQGDRAAKKEFSGG